MYKHFKHFKHLLLTFSVIGMGFVSHAQTSDNGVPKGWHLKDYSNDWLYGISMDKAYDFVKDKKSRTVIVAVIDSGIDTTHQDLKPVLWRNPKEIAGNGIDDGKNGYVDDIHGWNFIGGKDGRNVKEDSYEASRVYQKFKAKYDGITNPSTLSQDDRETYKMWMKAENKIVDYAALRWLSSIDSVLRTAMGKDTYTGTDLEAFIPTADEAKKARASFLSNIRPYDAMEMTNKAFLEGYIERKKEAASENARQNYRAEVVKDNYEDLNDRFYGNSNVMANTPYHGTHVAGIIGAVRDNGKGIGGIADNVRIMTIRAVPNGDEHDKDIALAIRYAVDNGARVINMSFGKSFSPEKHWVDDAVKYAESKGVLLVKAAGNSGANLDAVENFPNPIFKADGQRAGNWITVGASGPKIDGPYGVVAHFSNYGKSRVDVFAPGLKIYSTIPGGNTYGDAQGTSMASPVVAGIAAFILQYYPTLTPQQVKEVIENSTTKITAKVIIPKTREKVDLSEICKTGGIVNAYEAIRLADQINSRGTPAATKAKPAKKNAKKKKSKKTNDFHRF